MTTNEATAAAQTIDVYPAESCYQFTEFHPDAAEVGAPAGYAVVPFRYPHNMIGTCFGDVDDSAVDTILQYAEDAGAALVKHYQRRGMYAAVRTWRGYSQGDWCDFVVAGETLAYQDEVATDYGHWLAGDVYEAHVKPDDYWATFCAPAWDMNEVTRAARAAADISARTPVTVYEPRQTTTWAPVSW